MNRPELAGCWELWFGAGGGPVLSVFPNSLMMSAPRTCSGMFPPGWSGAEGCKRAEGKEMNVTPSTVSVMQYLHIIAAYTLGYT